MLHLESPTNPTLQIYDIKAIAEYTLGQYRRTASPDDITAYDADTGRQLWRF